MRAVLLLVGCAAAVFGSALFAPERAAAAREDACVLPSQRPLWLDFGTPDVEAVMARPGLVLSGSSGDFPARLRSKGVRTVYWDMYLSRRVGTATAPAPADTIVERANRLYEFAVTQMDCRDPIIALNELHGASLETPWSERYAAYRANVMTFIKTLAERGARPHLLVAHDAYNATEEAAEWWRAAAVHATLVRQVYFSYKPLHKSGAVLANRRIRVAMRRAITRLTEIGVRPARTGIMVGFHPVGAPGLQQTAAFELVKWQTLAAARVARELSVPYVWSWGWGTYSASIDRTAKPKAACVYLWTRTPRLCNGPSAAGDGFDASLTEGQLILPAGAQCTVGKRTIGSGQVSALARLTGDRDIAASILLARLAESSHAPVTAARVIAAERSVVQLRFGGSDAAYRAALRRANASRSIARAALADEIRRAQIEATLRGRRPSAEEIETFYLSYPDQLVRDVRVRPEKRKPAGRERERARRGARGPAWLGGRTRGLVLHAAAPQQLFTLPAGRALPIFGPDRTYTVTAIGAARTLGSVPFAEAKEAIAAALTAFARRAAFESWSQSRQRSELSRTTCRRDDVPDAGTVRLTAYLPFLSLTA
jgi:hypothetical protein